MQNKFENNTTGEIIFASTGEDKNGKLVATIDLDQFLEHFSLVVDLKKDLMVKPKAKKSVSSHPDRCDIWSNLNDENELMNYTRD